MHMMRSPDPRRRRRLLPVVVTALAAAAALTACGTSNSSAGAGSATSGSITWWGWTPTNEGAETYIKAFNKAYPHIQVTFKALTIAGYDAAMRPALASTTVGAGAATPAQAAAALEKTMKSQSS
jgi:ABC-type glycerol-3-phosphate transport system substrate-binding protein